MFCPMQMFLQGQDAAWHDHDALDLESFASINRIVVSPWTVDPTMVSCFGSIGSLEIGHKLLDALGSLTRQYQNGVGGCNNDEIFDANYCSQLLFSVDQTILRPRCDHGPPDCVTAGVALRDLENRIPATDVGPSE